MSKCKCVCDWYDSDICLHCKNLLRKSEEEIIMEKHTNKDGLTIAEGQLVSWYSPYMKKSVLTVVTELKESVFNEDIILVCGNWSDTNGTSTEHVKADEITGVWDIVDFRKVPTKPYKQLVAYRSIVKGRLKWGVYAHTDDSGNVWAYWEGWDTEDIAYGRMSLDEILRVEDIIIHEEKPKAFSFKDFDASVKRTWKDQDFKDAVSNAALGLTGEAGEVADLIKKAVYHGRGFNDGSLRVRSIGYDYEHGVSPEDVKDELSDVLYYVSATAQEFGFTLEDVAKHNKEKLEKRFPEGFSTEASAQKADRNTVELNVKVNLEVESNTYKTELPKEYPYFAKVIGDSMPNPSVYPHGYSKGTIVEVFSENTSSSVKARSVNSIYSGQLTINKVDLEYVTKPEEVQK